MLLNTTVRRWDGAKCYYPTAMLNAAPLLNLSRSENRVEAFTASRCFLLFMLTLLAQSSTLFQACWSQPVYSHPLFSPAVVPGHAVRLQPLAAYAGRSSACEAVGPRCEFCAAADPG